MNIPFFKNQELVGLWLESLGFAFNSVNWNRVQADLAPLTNGQNDQLVICDYRQCPSLARVLACSIHDKDGEMLLRFNIVLDEDADAFLLIPTRHKITLIDPPTHE